MADRFLTGSRIRDRRLERGMQQLQLAAAAGISPSYLNLIEHNRRPIAGKLLHDIARALGVEPAALTEGSEPARIAALRLRGAAHGLSAAELARGEDLAARFPGWAGLIEAQARQIDRLEARMSELSDRLEHDPDLARALHEVMTAVTAIHSAASILVDSDDLDRDWQGRFSRNIHQDSRKLAEASRALVRYLDRPEGAEPPPLDPQGEVEAWLGGQGGPVTAIETGGDPAAVVEAAGLSDAAGWILLRWLRLCAEDAAALPIASFAPVARAAAWDPARLWRDLAQPPARILRRLATLAPAPGQPAMGLAVADGGGAILHVKADGGFGLPRGGAACPLWPLFSAIARPGWPIRQRVAMPGPDGARYLVHAFAEILWPPVLDGPGQVRSTMLVTRSDAGPPEALALALGRSCRVCPRAACDARREPSVLRAVAAKAETPL